MTLEPWQLSMLHRSLRHHLVMAEMAVATDRGDLLTQEAWCMERLVRDHGGAWQGVDS